MVLEANISLHLFLVISTANKYLYNGKDYIYQENYEIWLLALRISSQENPAVTSVEDPESSLSVLWERIYYVLVNSTWELDKERQKKKFCPQGHGEGCQSRTRIFLFFLYILFYDDHVVSHLAYHYHLKPVARMKAPFPFLWRHHAEAPHLALKLLIILWIYVLSFAKLRT